MASLQTEKHSLVLLTGLLKFFPYVQHETSNEYQIHKNLSTLIDGMMMGECFKIKESKVTSIINR